MPVAGGDGWLLAFNRTKSFRAEIINSLREELGKLWEIKSQMSESEGHVQPPSERGQQSLSRPFRHLSPPACFRIPGMGVPSGSEGFALLDNNYSLRLGFPETSHP